MSSSVSSSPEREPLDILVAQHLEHGPFIPGVSGQRPLVLANGPLAAFAAPTPMSVDGEVHASVLLADALVRAGAKWETHEVLEALWLACGRTGPAADVLKAIIKLCAADVKTSQGQLAGRASHTHGASTLLDDLRRQHASIGGIDIEGLRNEASRMIADDAANLRWIPFVNGRGREV